MSTPPATQITYLTISRDAGIENRDTSSGQLWDRALDLLEHYRGFRRLYWGRSPEETGPSYSFMLHQDFGLSPEHGQLQRIFEQLVVPGTSPVTRHAFIQELTPSNPTLGKGAPFAGTAIYVGADDIWHSGAWPLWISIVPHVDGCLGVTGGAVVESVDGHDSCYVVYVGWESIEKHNAYHHTRHFAKHRVVLSLGNTGWREYGYVAFQAARESRPPGELQGAPSCESNWNGTFSKPWSESRPVTAITGEDLSGESVGSWQ